MSGPRIFFLHPGYPAHTNVLFCLPCVDATPDGRLGVHHRTALMACQIVANNAFHGYLALDADGLDRVASKLDDVLIESLYYFIVPGGRDYPIVPSFRDWQFPRENFPSSWPSAPRKDLTDSDALCLISRDDWAITNAHIIPSSQVDWFKENSMEEFASTRSSDIDDEYNILRLRSDLRNCFNQFIFSFMPKPSAHSAYSGTEDLTYTVHVLKENSPESFVRTHHGTQLPHLRGASREFLFSRFALTVFQSLKQFVTKGRNRRIIRSMVLDESKGHEFVCEELDGKELERQYGDEHRRRRERSETESTVDCDSCSDD